MNKPENIILRIDGIDWKGWKSCQITRTVEAIAGGFALGLTDRWVQGQEALPIAAGAQCEIFAGSDSLIAGYVDKVSHNLSATDHGITIEGRDKSADIVDCGAIHSPGQWTNATVGELASILAKPFGVPVTVQGDVGGPFPSFKLEVGETALDAVKRALKQRELLALPDGKGGIVLAKFGQVTMSTVLEQGKNVLKCSSTFDAKERFSEYVVQGQKQGNNKEFGAACSVMGRVTDAAVQRYRPKVLRADQQGDAAYMRKRAVWEKTTRAAKSTSVHVTVQGWRSDDGQLWQIGHKVRAKLPYLYIDQELLIAKTVFTKSSSGTVCEMDLKDPDAYLQEPVKPKKGGEGAGNAGFELYVQQSRTAAASGQAMKGAL